MERVYVVGCGSKAFIIYLHVNDNSFGVEKGLLKGNETAFQVYEMWRKNGK